MYLYLFPRESKQSDFSILFKMSRKCRDTDINIEHKTAGLKYYTLHMNSKVGFPHTVIVTDTHKYHQSISL